MSHSSINEDFHAIIFAYLVLKTMHSKYEILIVNHTDNYRWTQKNITNI
jgi:hypothetical protein